MGSRSVASAGSRTGSLREPIPYRVAPRAHPVPGRSASPSRTGSLREPIPYRVAPRAHPVPGRSASPSRTGSLREPIPYRDAGAPVPDAVMVAFGVTGGLFLAIGELVEELLHHRGCIQVLGEFVASEPVDLVAV